MKTAPTNAFGGAGPLILGISWTETLLATVILLVRAYGAVALERAGWDLFWSTVAWVTAFTAQAFMTVATSYGTGNHVVNLTPSDIEQSVKWSWIAQLIAIIAIGLGKVAVIALIIRIQGPTHKRKSYLLHFIWISNTIINISQVVLLLYQCTPVSKLWNTNLHGQCNGRIRAEHSGFFQGSWSAASDFVLAIYPIFVFWPLNISLKRKLGLCLLMGGGLLAGVAGLLKTAYISRAPMTEDITYSMHPLVICAMTEMWAIIIVGNIPQLRIVFVRAKHHAGDLVDALRAWHDRTYASQRARKCPSIESDLDRQQYQVGIKSDSKNQQPSVRRFSEGQESIRLGPSQIHVTTDLQVFYEDTYDKTGKV